MKVLALLRRVPLVWWLVATLVLFGAVKAFEVNELQASIAKSEAASQGALTKASETARAKEQAAAVALGKINDALQAATRARADERAASARRLRKLAEDYRARSAAAATCSGLEVPAAALVPDAVVSALVDLAHDADEVADSLRACQAYIRDVVQPGADAP